MAQHAFASAAAPSRYGKVRRGATLSLYTVNQRLADTERELRVQFTRIAQLQAQIDLVMSALRHPPNGVRL